MISNIMLAMYLVLLLWLWSSLVVLLTGAYSAGCRVAHRLNVSTFAATMTSGLSEFTLRCPVHMSASWAWSRWLQRSTSLRSGALRRGERRSERSRRGIWWMSEQRVAMSWCWWMIVNGSALQYLCSKRSELRANGMHFCCAGVL